MNTGNRNRKENRPERAGVEAAGAPVDETGRPVTVLPVIEEELSVSKQQRVTGKVRVRKTVREEEAVVDEPLLSERVEVERVSVNRPVSELPAPRQEGEILITPLLSRPRRLPRRLFPKRAFRSSGHGYRFQCGSG